MAAEVDASLMLFSASLTASLGGLFIVNRRWLTDLSVWGIRLLTPVYGRKITDRVAESSTANSMAWVGVGALVFSGTFVILLVVRLDEPLSVATIAASAILGALELVGALCFLIAALLGRHRRASVRRQLSARSRQTASGLILAVAGASTMATASWLLVLAQAQG